MQKIINHLLQCKDWTCTLDALQDELQLSRENLLKLVQVNCFRVCGASIVYVPPYGIYDRTSLETVIQNAYPMGIPLKELKKCYEFAESDLHRLLFHETVHIHTFGKCEEKIAFKPRKKVLSIQFLWDKMAVQMKHRRVPIMFKKQK